MTSDEEGGHGHARADGRGACPFGRGATGSPVRGPVHRGDRWLVDDQGRVVVLHGFNVVQKNPPYVRSEFGKRDARLLARDGFTVVRLPFLWAGVEPQPGPSTTTPTSAASCESTHCSPATGSEPWSVSIRMGGRPRRRRPSVTARPRGLTSVRIPSRTSPRFGATIPGPTASASRITSWAPGTTSPRRCEAARTSSALIPSTSRIPVRTIRRRAAHSPAVRRLRPGLWRTSTDG